MDSIFEIEGNFTIDDKFLCEIRLKDIPMYINIADWIDERNIYKIDTKEQFATIKPKKFGGLTYRVIDYIDNFAKIKTIDYGEVLIKITKETPISNFPFYERGNY